MISPDTVSDDLKLRPQRKRKRSSAERGLPPDADLRRLAKNYLELQRHLWPDLVRLGMLPEITPEVIEEMIESFKERHRNAFVDGKAVAEKHGNDVVYLGAFYGRYSCQNSQSSSIDDQMFNSLRKAPEQNRFIPWEYIFADYSVSGLDSSRHGFKACRIVIDANDSDLNTVYIDDFTRASRDARVWWELGQKCQFMKKGMVGASDGFNLADPNWEIYITIYGLVSSLYIKGLREKVKRGMNGAARRHRVLGKLPLGFTKRILRDDDQKIVRGVDGNPVHVVAIDPSSSELLKEIFELFTLKRLSAYKIAQQFNKSRKDNTDTWTESSIKNLLRNPAAIGVVIWNRFRSEKDPDTGKVRKIKNPRREWIVDYRKSLSIISMDTWRAAQRLFSQRRRGPCSHKIKTRNEISSTTLFSGTLVCECCGKQLTLSRSAGKYQSMYCPNGPTGIHGCKLNSNKSTRIIEKCLLDHITKSLLEASNLQQFVDKANAHLHELAARPKVNLNPIQSALRNLRSKIDRLSNRVGDLDEENEKLRYSLERQIIRFEKEYDTQSSEFRNLQKENKHVPPPLTKTLVKRLLNGFSDVLKQEIPMAAEAIRQLTGPVSIRQERTAGRRGAKWIATFSPDFTGFMRYVSKNQNYPDSVTLEFLSHGKWITRSTVDVLIDEIPNYERLAPEFKRLRENGASINTIAAAHGMCWQQANEILEFADHGTRPSHHKPGKKTNCPRKRNDTKYKDLSVEVTKRRGEGHSFARIAKELNVGEGTVRRAWDFNSKAAVDKAARSGEIPDRGEWRHLDSGKLATVRRLLTEGVSVKDAAARTGISQSTVRREKKQLSL